MNPSEVRTIIIQALFSDDDLMDSLVLKGGNALALVHKVGDRASVDIDCSILDEFSDVEDIGNKIRLSLEREFGRYDYSVFDFGFEAKPAKQNEFVPDWWGGYVCTFKLVDQITFEKYKGDYYQLRNRASEVGPSQKKVFKIDISKFEACQDKVIADINDLVVYAYSLEMIAVEKLRAICQQLPDYELNYFRTARARDFYDIHEIVNTKNIDLHSDANLQLIKDMFQVKKVPLEFLAQVKTQRSFHQVDWPSVTSSVSGKISDFDYYFDFVTNLIGQLEALWKK